MSFKCATSMGGEWTSKLTSDAPGSGEVDDGTIEIDIENSGTGEFLGTHLNSGGMIVGRCGAGSGATCTDASCHIEFERRTREGGHTFTIHYEADFMRVGPNYVTQNGRYRKRQRGRQVERAILAQGDDDGTWVGQKPVS